MERDHDNFSDFSVNPFDIRTEYTTANQQPIFINLQSLAEVINFSQDLFCSESDSGNSVVIPASINQPEIVPETQEFAEVPDNSFSALMAVGFKNYRETFNVYLEDLVTYDNTIFDLVINAQDQNLTLALNTYGLARLIFEPNGETTIVYTNGQYYFFCLNFILNKIRNINLMNNDPLIYTTYDPAKYIEMALRMNNKLIDKMNEHLISQLARANRIARNNNNQ